jgi:D-lactate dehydrogenase
MGALPGEARRRTVPQVMIDVAGRAGVRLHVPAGIDRRCCGMPFGSKGFTEAQAIAANAAIDDLWTASNGGALPVVVDSSPCAYALTNGEGLTPSNASRLAQMRIVDAVDYFASSVLPALTLHPIEGTVVLHPVCSLVKMGNAPKLKAVAAACSRQVFVPLTSGCCGFAGDRGFLVPELTASATRIPAAEVRSVAATGHYSSSRTCEIGMMRATERPYESWIHLVDDASAR